MAPFLSPDDWFVTQPAMVDVLERLAEAEPPPASLVAEMAATRPVGGKRKRTSSAPARGPGAGGRRVRRDTVESILVDAADAAGYLARCDVMWDATHILAHASVARLAVSEALAELDRERSDIESRRVKLSRRARKKALADVALRSAMVSRAAELLATAHERDLVRGD